MNTNIDWLHESAVAGIFFSARVQKVVDEKGLAQNRAKITQVRSYSHTYSKTISIATPTSISSSSAPPLTLNLHLDQVSRHINTSNNLGSPSRWYEAPCPQSMRFVNLEKSPLLPT